MNITVYQQIIIETQASHLLVRCGRCQGTGSRDRDGSRPECSVCNGVGTILLRIQNGSLIRCGFCQGDGTRDRDGRDPVCPACRGVGGLFRELPAGERGGCDGTGSRDRDGTLPLCPTCDGSGVVPIREVEQY